MHFFKESFYFKKIISFFFLQVEDIIITQANEGKEVGMKVFSDNKSLSKLDKSAFPWASSAFKFRTAVIFIHLNFKR
jgi:hypothetical protein